VETRNALCSLNDELPRSVFPNLPEDTCVVDEISRINTDENVRDIIAAKVEDSDINLKTKKNFFMLFLSCLEQKIELNDSSPLKS
jgi:hypothetical protein